MAKRKRRDHSWKRLKAWRSANIQSFIDGFRAKPLSEWRIRRLPGPPIDFGVSVQKACKEFGLDPTSAHDRNILLLIFADSLYPPDPLPILYRALDGQIYEWTQSGWPSERRGRGSSGRPVEWTKSREDKFKRDKTKAAKGPSPTTNRATIAHRLKNPLQFGPFELDYSEPAKSVVEGWLARPPRSRSKKPDRAVRFNPEHVLFEEIEEAEEAAPRKSRTRSGEHK